MSRTGLFVTALSMLTAALAPGGAPAQTYIEPFWVEDGIFLYRQAVRAAHRDLSAEAADFARSSIETLQSCVPIATEQEKAEIYYFVGRNHMVLGDLDEAEKWFKKAAEIQFSAPEAYGALLKIVNIRGPHGPEHREDLIEARKPIYEAARRVCPYNTSLLFPILGGFLNPRSESAEATRGATGRDPKWIAKEQPVYFRVPPVVSSNFVQMRMWDEAIRAYKLARYTRLKFESTRKRFQLPYAAQTYAAIGDCYLAKRDYRNAIIWYRRCLGSHSIKKIAYISAYLNGEPISVSPLIEESKTIVSLRKYREAGADLPPMDRDWFTHSRIGEQDLSMPQGPAQPDAAKIEQAADAYVRDNNSLYEEAIRLYRLAEELCGVSLKDKIAQTYEKYAEMLDGFRKTRDKYATLMGRNITYAVAAEAYLQAQGAYEDAGDDESAARMLEKAGHALDLDEKEGG